MSTPHHIFGPDFQLGGTLYDEALNFRFEVWARSHPLPDGVLEQVYSTWRRGSRKNVPKKNQTVSVQWIGDSLLR
jgi:hypothetical protein